MAGETAGRKLIAADRPLASTSRIFNSHLEPESLPKLVSLGFVVSKSFLADLRDWSSRTTDVPLLHQGPVRSQLQRLGRLSHKGCPRALS